MHWPVLLADGEALVALPHYARRLDNKCCQQFPRQVPPAARLSRVWD